MDGIIAKINGELRDDSHKTCELEVRLGKINVSSYRDSLEKLMEGMDIKTADIITKEQSMSIISIDRARRNTLLYMRKTYGPKPIVQIMHKVKIATYDGILPDSAIPCQFKVALSRELLIENAPEAATTDKVRYRIRTSRMIKIGDHLWTLDLTLIRQANYGDIIKRPEIKNDFFKNEDATNADDYPIHYEVELELVQQGGTPITKENIFDAARFACKIGYPRGIIVGVSHNARELLLNYVAHLMKRVRPAGRNDGRALSLSSILNNARSMTKHVYLDESVYPLDDYAITDKADGVRGIAIISRENNEICVITEEKLYCKESVITHFTDDTKIGEIYDGEVIVADNGHDISFYAFDCIMTDGELITNQPFEQRIMDIREITDKNDSGIMRIIAKKFSQVGDDDDIEKAIRAVVDAPRPYKIDGLIFTQLGEPYAKTLNWKWKSYEDTTIDFLCMECPERLYGSGQFTLPHEASQSDAGSARRSDFRIYILYCTCDVAQRASLCITPLPVHNEIIAPEMRNNLIHFVCPFEPFAYVQIMRAEDMKNFDGDIHGKVFEMRWRKTEDRIQHDSWRKWDINRIRSDKTVGNNIAIATDVFANYIDPFEMEQLWHPSGGYFEEDTKGGLVASNKYRRFILTTILYHNLSQFKNGSRILELGGGRAQDYVRYAVSGARLVVNYDNDSMALATSVKRVEKNSKIIGTSAAMTWLKKIVGPSIESRNGMRDSQTCSAPAYVARVANLRELNPDAFRNDLLAIGASLRSFNAVISTFAFHYFCVNASVVRNIFKLIDIALSDNGIIMITTMNGEFVYKLLRENGGVWRVDSGDDRGDKYKITAAYPRNDPLREFGQMIKVSVPFSNQLYDEPLCNFGAVATIAGEFGFVRAEIPVNYGANEFMTLLRKTDSGLADAIAPDDIKYSSLFETVIFRRKTKSLAART